MISRILVLAGLAAFARSLLRYDEAHPEGDGPTNEFEQRLARLEQE